MVLGTAAWRHPSAGGEGDPKRASHCQCPYFPPAAHGQSPAPTLEEQAHLEPGLALLPPRKTRRARSVGPGVLPTTPCSNQTWSPLETWPSRAASQQLCCSVTSRGLPARALHVCGQEPPETLGTVPLPPPRLPHPPPPHGHLPGHPVSQPACGPVSALLSVSGNRTCRKVLAWHLHTVASTV